MGCREGDFTIPVFIRRNPTIRFSNLRCPVALLFGAQDGIDAFGNFPVEDLSAIKLKRPRDYSRPFWHPEGANTVQVWVVCGRSGAGKSRWISEHVVEVASDNEFAIVLRFAVHEGFSVATVIERFTAKISKLENNILPHISLIFDVYPEIAQFGFASFAQFLHHLLSLGILLDEVSGKAASLSAQIKLDVSCSENHFD